MFMFTVICDNMLCHTKYFVVVPGCQEKKDPKNIFSVILGPAKLAPFIF